MELLVIGIAISETTLAHITSKQVTGLITVMSETSINVHNL